MEREHHSGRRWLCSQVGAREHYAIPAALHARGRLAGLVTDWYAPGHPALRWLLGRCSRSAAAARSDALPDALVRSFPLRSLVWKRQVRRLGALGRVSEAHEQTDRAFASALAGLKLPPHDVFFGYSYASLETLAAEKRRGVATVLGQTDPGAWEFRLVAEELERFPELAGPPPPFPARNYERNRREWELADRIVVNSGFAREALIQQGVDPAKLVLVPLAYEPSGTQAAQREAGQPEAGQREAGQAAGRRLDGPLRVLFLGQVIPRKGIHYLLAAARLLDPQRVRFEVVGPLGIRPAVLAGAPPNVTFHGRAARDAAAGWYARADVFVLPTLSDGFALTQLEAMSHGLPVVATPCCGEVVTDGVDGQVVPARDPERLAAALDAYLAEPELLAAQGRAARVKAGLFTPARLQANLEQLEQDLERASG